MSPNVRVLLIDDNPDDRYLAARALTQGRDDVEAVEVAQASDLEQALSAGGFDAVITDYRLNWSDGLQVLRRVKALYPHVPVLMVTDTGTEEIAVEGMKFGLSDYVLKQHIRRLPLALHESLDKARLSRQYEEARRELQRAKDGLETRVHERTAELAASNEELAEANHRLQSQAERLQRLADDLDAERERVTVTLRAIADGVIASNASGSVVLMNGAAEALTGWREAEAIGRPLAEVFHILNETTGEREEDLVARVLSTGEAMQPADQTALIARDASKHSVEASAAPMKDARSQVTGAVLVFRDVTVQRKLESELLTANKLESLGLLAGGIAHDFNNLLTGIMGNIAVAKLEVPRDSEIAEVLEEAELASVRAKALTQRLLTFAKGGSPIKKRIRLPQLLRESCETALRGNAPRCQFDVPGSLWPVEVDAGQVAQVMQNLIVNAHEAMPRGGTVTVSAGNVQIGPSDALPLPAGMYVKVTVADEGVGIPGDIIGRVFDPYFTTKTNGHGIGLAVCYSVVAQHGGHIMVESEPGAGSRFHVYLPAASSETPTETVEAAQSLGRVLVMDDDEMVLTISRRMLLKLGYRAETATSGAEAVALYRQALEAGDPFDAVILDLVVPNGMGGVDTLARLQDLDPEVAAIVSSGYSNDPAMAHFRRYGFAAMVDKPYRFEDLEAALRAAVAR
ncbi:MAG: response regulator [Anaerolineae bacterium]